MGKTSVFEYVLLLVGLGAAFLGFQFINNQFLADGQISWNMVHAIFLWLIVLLLLILMSLSIYISKNQLEETKRLAESLVGSKKKKK